jgi:hypothetical protein
MKILAFNFVCALCMATAAHAANITANPGDNLQFKLNAAANGTLTLGAGTFNLSQPLSVHSGATVIGAPGLASHLIFHLGPADNQAYGLNVDPNASNVTISGIDFASNRGVFALMAGNGYNNISFIANSVTHGGGQTSNGVDVFGLSGTVQVKNLQVCWNLFHDTQNCNRTWYFWAPSNSNFDHNLYTNICDGGQLNSPGANISYSYNYATLLHGKMQETAEQSANNFQVVGNVSYDYFQMWQESEGVSICTTGGNAVSTSNNSVNISNNYFRMNLAAGSSWGPKDPNTNRSGYGIEVGGYPATVSNNVIGGTAIPEFISCMTTNVQGTGNKLYGTANLVWNSGAIAGEPGPYGFGSSAIVGTAADANYSDMPQPPSNTIAGPTIYNATSNGTQWTPTWTPAATNSVTPTTPQAAAPTLVHTIAVMSDGSVSVK